MQDNDCGYIQIPRAHPIWSFRPYDLRVALELIRRATHKDITFRHHGTDIQLKRGQLFISIRQLSRDCGIDREALRRVIARLNSTHFLTHTCTHLGIVVSVCDYNYFNDSKYPYQPTPAPTFAPIVGVQTTQSGCFEQPPLYNEQGTKNNQVINNQVKKVLTIENFDITEAKTLIQFFPKKDDLVSHLRTRGYIEDAIQKIIEMVFNKQEAQAYAG